MLAHAELEQKQTKLKWRSDEGLQRLCFSSPRTFIMKTRWALTLSSHLNSPWHIASAILLTHPIASVHLLFLRVLIRWTLLNFWCWLCNVLSIFLVKMCFSVAFNNGAPWARACCSAGFLLFALNVCVTQYRSFTHFKK